MPDIFAFFQKRRIALTKQEIQAKKELCVVQATLNKLLKEEPKAKEA